MDTLNNAGLFQPKFGSKFTFTVESESRSWVNF